MTTRYVDPAAGGTNDGTSWTNAWTSFQTAADTAVAGDVVYCRGSQTLSARIDIDTQTGSNAAGFIKFIGCNASGNVDGTRFVLNGNSGGYHIVNIAASIALIWWENIEVKNTGAGSYAGFCFADSDANGHVFINCCANNCGENGWEGWRSKYALFIRCVSYSNTGGGYRPSISDKYICCCARDNTGSGMLDSVGETVIGCIFHGNQDDGVHIGGLYGGVLFNCVMDGNADVGVHCARADNWAPFIIGCRITNQSGSGDIGIDANNDPAVIGYCYFENNDGDNIQNVTLYQFIPLEGGSSTSNIEDAASVTTYGYVDPTNHDFSTNYDVTDPDNIRRKAITIPWS